MVKEVIQVTTVHPWKDPRIFERTVCTLAEHGYNVHYIAPYIKYDDTMPSFKNIEFHWLPANKGFFFKLKRFSKVFNIAVKEKKAIIHFHDPELMPLGLIFRLLGRNVIYDIHEDNYLGIQQKHYLNNLSRFILSRAVSSLEWLVHKSMPTIIAEKAYANRFPKAHLIQNFLKINDTTIKNEPTSLNPIRLLYTGCVSEDRGIYNHLELLKNLPECELHITGMCRDLLKEEILKKVNSDLTSDRLFLDVSSQGVPFSKIINKYKEGNWTAGLVIFPDTPHYREKELTKFFEYMAFGVPIICSNFKIWSQLIKKNGIGLCVDPDNIMKSVKEIKNLHKDLERRKKINKDARQIFSDRYNFESEMNTLVKLYACIK